MAAAERWILELPLVCRYLALSVSVAAALIPVGICVLFMAGESAGGGEGRLFVKRAFILTAGYALIGLISIVALVLFIGPFAYLLDGLQWPYLPSLLVGLPAGFVIVVGAYGLLDWIVRRVKRVRR